MVRRTIQRIVWKTYKAPNSLLEDRYDPSHGSPSRKNSGQRCMNSACSRYQRRSFSSLASSLPREVNS